MQEKQVSQAQVQAQVPDELRDEDLEGIAAGKGSSQQAVIGGGRGVVAQQGRGRQQAVIGGKR